MSLALYYVLAYLAVAFVVAGLIRVVGMLFRDAVDWCARRLPPQRQEKP